MTLPEAITHVMSGQSLRRADARAAMEVLMSGAASPVQIAAYLTALRVKGETVEELAGSADAMRAASIPVRVSTHPIVDTCGTGGDGQHLLNVSTIAAFVVAGAGFTVAKHGNRSVSSRCGSADLLSALGLAIELPSERVESCLREIGIAFLFAPSFHPAMRHAMPVRQELAVRTIFNLLGPLTNPARADVQIIGVYEPRWVQPLAETLVEMGAQEGVVVHGNGADEIALSGPTQVAEIVGGRVQLQQWVPEDFGVMTQSHAALAGGTPTANAALARDVLQGLGGPAREIVCMNAAALIRAANRARTDKKYDLSLKDAYRTAEQSIDSHAALAKLEALKAYLAGGATS